MASSALLQELSTFLHDIEHEKVAARKRAEAHTEVGGTTHPSKDVEDNTQPATEGSRSAENTSDIKKDIATGGVDSAITGVGTTQETAQSQTRHVDGKHRGDGERGISKNKSKQADPEDFINEGGGAGKEKENASHPKGLFLDTLADGRDQI